MSYLDRIAECNDADLSRYVPLAVGADVVGWVRRDRVGLLDGCVDEDGGRLLLHGADYDERTATLDRATDAIVAAGEIPARHGERFAMATAFGADAVAELDRAVVSWFGVRAFGVHLNGFVRDSAGFDMWVAFRARGKLTFPGMLDNMVAGGQPIGLSPEANVRKECAEEAGIPDEIARRARPVGAVSYCAEHERGLKPDTMFCYDLELPRDFEPVCTDGEVERFELMPVEDVAAIVRDSARFKFNCNLVVIDFLVRHGLLGADDPDYLAIVDGLHQPLPPGGFA